MARCQLADPNRTALYMRHQDWNVILLCLFKPQELLTNILFLLKNSPISKDKQRLCHRSIQALNSYGP